MMDETTSGLEADMDDAPQNHPGTGHDSSATMIAADAEAPADGATPESAPDGKPASASSPQSSLQRLWRGQRGRFARMAVIAATLAALAFLLPSLIASNGRRPTAQTQPTAKPQPTATTSPTPTLIPGFQYVADSEDGFTLQAPQSWTCAETNPGIECRDDADAPNYKAQIQLPGDWTVPGGQPNGNDASPWVNYALNAFSETPGQVFERTPGPASTVTINGVRWQTSGGLISVDTSSGQDGTPTATPPIHIRVQVYATIHNDKPYLIALYSTDEQFTFAKDQYFQPMLRSFQFIPTKL
jgi:hypothetical protein